MESYNNENYESVQNSYAATDPNKSVMTLGEWILTLIVMMIPCVNLIMMLIWAFGNGNENRKNYCRANLIVTAVSTVLIVILYATIFAGLIASSINY